MQAIDVPLLGISLLRNAFDNDIVNHLVAHIRDCVGYVFDVHQLAALLVNDAALVVHDIVKTEEIFTDFEIAFFDFLLCLLESFVDPWVDDGFAFL